MSADSDEVYLDHLRRRRVSVDRAAPLCRVPTDEAPSVIPDIPKLTDEEGRALDTVKAAAFRALAQRTDGQQR